LKRAKSKEVKKKTTCSVVNQPQPEVSSTQSFELAEVKALLKDNIGVKVVVERHTDQPVVQHSSHLSSVVLTVARKVITPAIVL